MKEIDQIRRRGFTLVEMVLNLTVLTLLMGVLSSAILIAGRAIPDPKSPQQASARAYEAAEQIAAELYGAASFMDRTDRTVEFTVADRNADAVPETIRYEWSGTPGDPLMRQYNGGTQIAVVNDLHQFAFSYVNASAMRQPPPTPTESAEIVLSSKETLLSLIDFTIGGQYWPGQFFLPALPPGAVSWKVTKVQFKARKNGTANGIIAVQLRPPTAGNVPSATVLEQYLMYESALPLLLYGWQTFWFSNVSGRTPGTGLCLVLAAQQGASDLADIQIESAGASNLLETDNAGVIWKNEPAKSMVYKVYGKYETMTTPPPTTVTFITLVGISLQIGSNPASRVETTVQILNRPEVPLL